ncbi:MAG: NUDIX domain-containing protein [Bacilli bacterium]|nr:NUDIX domain-containing protein [Bacilli bacterium]
MANYTWYNTDVPNDLKVKQVYGIAFSNDFEVLLRIEDNKYKLTGGKPEKNESYEETLKREYIEELNVELEDCHYLGYLLVEDNNEKYAQVRMIAKIKSINENHIDPATGKMYGRELVKIDRVRELLNYQDEAGNLMIDEAIEKAKEMYN